VLDKPDFRRGSSQSRQHRSGTQKVLLALHVHHRTVPWVEMRCNVEGHGSAGFALKRHKDAGESKVLVRPQLSDSVDAKRGELGIVRSGEAR
jgi:hypothetical protein